MKYYHNQQKICFFATYNQIAGIGSYSQTHENIFSFSDF